MGSRPPTPQPMVIKMPEYRPPVIKPDPNIGLAALKQADILEDELEWKQALDDREEAAKQQRKDDAIQNLFGSNYALGQDLLEYQNQVTNTADFTPGGYIGNLADKIKSGLLTYNQAEQRIRDYADQNKLSGTQYPTIAEDQLMSYWDTFNEADFGRRAARQYELMVGKPLDLSDDATLRAFGDIYTDTGAADYGYDVDKFTQRVLESKAYQDQFNDNYLDQYYDIEYGKAVNPETGEVELGSGQRTFDFGKLGALPEFPKIDIEGTDFQIPVTPGADGKFTGTIQEIKQAQQERNQQLNFYYNSGLTALQGNIDKNIQELKNKGAKEIAQINRSASTMAAALGQI